MKAQPPPTGSNAYPAREFMAGYQSRKEMIARSTVDSWSLQAFVNLNAKQQSAEERDKERVRSRRRRGPARARKAPPSTVVTGS